VEEAEGGFLGVTQVVPVAAYYFEQMEGADDVGLDEVFRAVDGAVDVALGGEVDDGARLLFGEQFADQGAVADVALDEDVALVAVQAGEVLQVAGVGEFVEIEDRLVVLSQPVEDEVRADEAGAAGDENHEIQPKKTRFHAGKDNYNTVPLMLKVTNLG